MSIAERVSNLSTAVDSIERTETWMQERTVASEYTLDQIVGRVAEKVTPVWPLRDYVAVNPFSGLSETDFLTARQRLRLVSDVELLMPIDYFAKCYQRGDFSKLDITTAIDELLADGVQDIETIDFNHLLASLRDANGDAVSVAAEPTPVHTRRRSLVEQLDALHSTTWNSSVLDELGKHCSDFYDQGQATWGHAERSGGLYAAWRKSMKHDWTLEVLGLRGFRRFVQCLPPDPLRAIEELLSDVELPRVQWEEQLWCEALSTPGWSAWTRYQATEAACASRSSNTSPDLDFASLLAMRLAYSVALLQHSGTRLAWGDLPTQALRMSDHSALSRLVLLRAMEVAYRRQVLDKVSSVALAQRVDHRPPVAEQNANSAHRDSQSRPAAQMVFCIDVRSERLRRHIEQTMKGVETFGFAGFFGMPIEYVSLGEQSGSPQVPVLIQPRFKVFEGCGCGPKTKADQSPTEQVLRQRFSQALRGRMRQALQSSAISTFSFVETTGLLYGFKLLGRLTDSFVSSRSFDSKAVARPSTAPSLEGLEEQGIGLEQRVAMAEGALRGIGLTTRLARLVVLCGHASQTENNPLQAGLDCGACGGHSGESNARFAARLLNDQQVRSGLAERGLSIPCDVHFLAGLHNTTTDGITLFDDDLLPASHREEFEALVKNCRLASAATRRERQEQAFDASSSDIAKRSRDWSEVRPEWGLAGNAAFIVGPRTMTSGESFAARSFLHSYDHHSDSDGGVLEQIMTAPLIVAHLINMQYYASTVAPRQFGSGSKTIHNVVGHFGVLAGNGGDLQTGLPWQSVHDGKDYQHSPLRLLAVIAAPRAIIAMIVGKYPRLQQLLSNHWLHLVAVEDGTQYRFTCDGRWERLRPAGDFA